MEYVIGYDLGTGGIKATLYNEDVVAIEKVFVEYPTYYPAPDFLEQKPADWWSAFCVSTKELLNKTQVEKSSVVGIALSGASLVSIPLDKDGNVLCEFVPIWSDKRADEEAKEFFTKVSQDEWYMTTGNGFPAPNYPLFKLMWLRKHKKEIFEKTAFVLGTKDYINYRLTGVVATDFSYASGSGAFDLKNKKPEEHYLKIADIPSSFFPTPKPSHTLLGKVKEEVCKECGLSNDTKVFLGGVDNACMAHGTVGTTAGKTYLSLGTSSWIPMNCTRPILDAKTKPYTFVHIGDNLYTSAYSIFSGGNSLRWLRDTLCEGKNYDQITELAKKSPVGSNGVMFHPALAGGTSQDKSIYCKGGYFGITLGTTKSDLIRSLYEGVAFALKISLNHLKTRGEVQDKIVFCGGGSKSDFWLQIFADVFNMTTIRTNIDQDAATLGAVSTAVIGLGWQKDYKFLDKLQKVEFEAKPIKENVEKYENLFPLFEKLNDFASDYGDFLHNNIKM